MDKTIPPGHYCVALHPICDRHFNHVADELIYTVNKTGPGDTDDQLTASARSYITIFHEIGLTALVGQRRLLVQVPRQWVIEPGLMQFPTESIIIGLPRQIIPNARTLSAVETLRESGYTLLADESLVERAPDTWLPRIDIVRLDLRHSPSLAENAARYAQSGVELMACAISTMEQFNQCCELSFSHFQGEFYAAAQKVAGSSYKRMSNRAASLQLLNALYGGDPEINRIETLLVQDPQLCALLFKRVHAASGERLRRATSLHQVIMLLGFDKIRALATTLLLAYDQPIKRFLVLKALVRASLARRLADHMDGVDPDMAFTVGLFSMMDQIEGLSLADTVGEARLDPVMADALLRHEGELGKILKLILAFENASLDDVALSQLGQLNGDYLASVAWAQDIIALSDAS